MSVTFQRTHHFTAALVVVFFFGVMGGFLFQRAQSLLGPTAGPGASGTPSADKGSLAATLGSPTDSATASSLFGQIANLQSRVDAIAPGGEVTIKRVFVTSTSYNGDLKTAGGGATGLQGADNLCQARANVASLGGTWKALLADSTTNAFDRLGYNWDLLTDLKGRTVMTRLGAWGRIGWDYSENISSINGHGRPQSLLQPIYISDLGSQSLNSTAWTGFSSDGFNAVGFMCNNWTTSSSGSYGGWGSANRISDLWASGGTTFCNDTQPLYCFEQ